MTFDLTKLGWKAFQDLATVVAAETLKRPVQTFLGSNDGGFLGLGPVTTVSRSS
ncbi:hypothetical protein [Mesorhizobium sp. B2-3-15]|uniref:hypothetical protein n=1 Tax=Mesorhizobium sp. B2-3-15 TaxID=2589949 RepID=UPI001AEE70FE|nr:hypothetical protein [Mesorhizobium sp. B2-3-15]